MKYTHLLMDGYKGGMVSIPPHLIQTFMWSYADAVDNGDKLFFLESRTPVFRFFVDADFKFKNPSVKSCFSNAELLVFYQLIQRTVMLFYPKTTPENKFLMCVAGNQAYEDASYAATLAEYKLKKSRNLFDDKKPIPPAPIKPPPSGNMHIHFPNLDVNEEQASRMGKAIIAKLHLIIGTLPYLEKPWEDVIDKSVYQKNGLRMAGSCKTGKCQKCKGKKCSVCIDTGKVNLGKVYRLQHVMVNQKLNPNVLENLTMNSSSEFSALSIRSNSTMTTPGWKPFQGCPKISSTVMETASEKRKIDPNQTTTQQFQKLMAADNKPMNTDFKEDLEGLKRKSLENLIDPNTRIYQICERLARGFRSCYKRVVIKNVKAPASFRYYVVSLSPDSEGATMCQNLALPKTEHNSNTVYFMIRPSGISQKCWCRCETEQLRHQGQCKDYESGKKILLDQDFYLLFPNGNVKKHRPDSSSASPFEQVIGTLYHNAYVRNSDDKNKKRKKGKS